METQSINISRVFNSPPIYDAIFSCLSPPALIQTSRTCRDVYRATTDFNKRAYNIMKHLRLFFDDPSSFRSMQASTGAVISGSNALQFFDRTYYPGSDLDIYVAQDFALETGSWLAEHEGYVYTPSKDQNPDFAKAWALSVQLHPCDLTNVDRLQSESYRQSGVSDVFNFQKEGRPKVQLVTTPTSPLHLILCVHTTYFMNFITFEGAYSLYPRATFSAHEAIAIGPILARDLSALEKYTTRGWSIRFHHSDVKSREPLFFFGEIRHVLDSHSWVIPFDIDSIQLRPSPTPSSQAFTSDPSRYNSWIMSNLDRPHTRFFAVNSKLLKFNYLVAEKSLLRNITSFLKKQGELECVKVESLNGDERERARTFLDNSYPSLCELYEAEKLRADTYEFCSNSGYSHYLQEYLSL